MTTRSDSPIMNDEAGPSRPPTEPEDKMNEYEMELEEDEEQSDMALPLHILHSPQWIKSIINTYVSKYIVARFRLFTKGQSLQRIQSDPNHQLLKISLHSDLEKLNRSAAAANSKDDFNDIIALYDNLKGTLKSYVIKVKTDEMNDLRHQMNLKSLIEAYSSECHNILTRKGNITGQDLKWVEDGKILLEHKINLAALNSSSKEIAVKSIKISKNLDFTKTGPQEGETGRFSFGEVQSSDFRRTFERSVSTKVVEPEDQTKDSNPQITFESKTPGKRKKQRKRGKGSKTKDQPEEESIFQKQINFYNLSNVTIPPHIHNILDLGLKFVPTPQSDLDNTLDEFSKSFDQLSLNTKAPYANKSVLKEMYRDSLLDKIILKRSKKNVNIRHLLNFLNKHDLLALESDKNLGFVIVNSSWYLQEVNKHLSDKKTYAQVNSVNYDDALKQIETIVSNYKDESKYLVNKTLRQTTDLIHRLGDEEALPIFHVLPKVHKTPVKTRPVIPSINSMTSLFSKYIDNLLQPVLRKFHWVVTGTLDTIHKLEELRVIDEDIMIISADAESLYTNIDVHAGLRHIKNLLTLEQFPVEKIYFIVETLQWIFNNNYFTFRRRKYRQINGIAMGTNCAPTFANLVLVQLERNSIIKNPSIINYLRFVDDTWIICKIPDASQVKKSFTNLWPRCLSWTFQTGTKVPFLDLLTKLDERTFFESKISYETYEKFPMSNTYTSPYTFQPKTYTYNWITSENIRLIRTNSTFQKYKENLTKFVRKLHEKEYSAEDIKRYITHTYSDRQRLLLLIPRLKPSDEIIAIDNSQYYNELENALINGFHSLTLLENVNKTRRQIRNRKLIIPIRKGKSIISYTNRKKKKVSNFHGDPGYDHLNVSHSMGVTRLNRKRSLSTDRELRKKSRPDETL